MTVDVARAAVITGDGVVARYPGLLCVARCSDRDVLLKLLDVCAGAAGTDPGRALARRLAAWMGGPDAPGDDLEFGTVATAGNQLGVFLVGSVAVAVPGSPVALSGADAATFTDRLIAVPGAPVVLALDGARPPAGLADDINDLRAGVVPGAGAVLFPVGRPAAPRPDPGAGPGVVSGLDGPTIRTPAHNGAAHKAATQVDPSRAGVVVQNDTPPQNGARNGTPRNGLSSLLAEESSTPRPEADPTTGNPRDRRPGRPGADPRTPNGYEWFADWSDGGGAPDAAPAPADTTTPDTPLPGAGRWPWTEASADRGPVRPDDDRRPGRGDDGRPGRGDDGRPGRGDDGRPGRANWTEPPTPPGGSARAVLPDERPQVWVDPADPATRDDAADRLQEGRHAIAGADEPSPHADPPAAEPAAAFLPAPVEIPAPAPVPTDVAARIEGADDATPVNAVAAVEPVPVIDEAPEVPDAQPLPAPEDSVPDLSVPDLSVPDLSVPDLGVPDLRAPDVKAPDLRAPDAEDAPSPAPRPTPAPRPQDQTGPGEVLPESDEPQLHGLLCEDGHLNDPRSSSCLVCGAPVAPGEDVVGPRPPLGRIVFDDGATFTVDAEYLVGRMPEADPRARSGELQPIVVEDRSGSVSRVHAEILINGWDVVLVDSGSRNGTFVAGPDDSGWTPLAPGRTSLLLPGTRVRMGGRTFVFEPPVAVG